LLLAAREDRYRARALALLQSLRHRLADTLQELAEQGQVPAWVRPEPMAGLIIAVANGIALQSQLDPDGPDHLDLAAQFAQLLLAAQPGSSVQPE